MGKDLLKDLNDVQLQAVKCTEGPVLIIAGAGSGKTRVLTYRIAYLVDNGIDPFRILALTFTNKAAKEMKERIIKLLGNTEARNVWMGTFHSIFARILRIEGHLLGYPREFSIFDTDDSKNLIKTIVKEQQLDPKQYAANIVYNRISNAKNNLISPEDYLKDEEISQADINAHKPMLGQLYLLYNQRLRHSAAMDFDDLLFNMNILFRDFPEILHKYQGRFQYIHVDEYQDTNYSQYLIVKALAAKLENICVVGDDAQSIYGFRGANIANILNFQSDYHDAEVFKLEQNYRSTKNIVNAANSLIIKNKKQIFKEIWTDNDDGHKIMVMKAASDNEEGSIIAGSIFETKMNNQLKNSDFAILYRTNAQSRSLEEALRKTGLAYRIYGGMSFYKRKEIKDLLAYFRLTVNNKDEEALFRIINYPARGIGSTTTERIIVLADKMQCSPWEIINNQEVLLNQVNSGILRKISEFATMIKSFAVLQNKSNAFDLASNIAKSSGILKELYEDRTPEGISRLENVEELLNAVKDFCNSINYNETEGEQNDDIPTLGKFMQEVSLLTDSDESAENEDHVSLMTIHSAKGLEFPYVYVTGMEENLFPSVQSLAERADLEEERRLFYVAITRAMKKLTLSYAECRYKWGDLVFCEPSRFLEEIDSRFIEMPRKHTISGNFSSGLLDAGLNLKNKVKLVKNELPSSHVSPPSVLQRKLKKIQESVASSSNNDFETVNEDIVPGVCVEHQKFGAGKVLAVEGKGANTKLTVLFNTAGQKQLLLQFAKLKIIKN